MELFVENLRIFLKYSNLTAALEAKTVIFKPANPGTPFHFPLGSDWLNGADKK